MKIYNKPRHSGKTTQLIDQIEWVNIFYGASKNICVVAPNWDVIQYVIKSKLKEKQINGSNINFCTLIGNILGTNPDFIFVDEYQYCNHRLIEYIKRYHSDKTIMWGTPE